MVKRDVHIHSGHISGGISMGSHSPAFGSGTTINQQPRTRENAPAYDGGRQRPVTPTQPKQWDLFISYASEDETYVLELARVLSAGGLRVWVDRTELQWGDDLRSKIDEGLRSCSVGLVVLSQAYLQRKKWTEYELSGLLAQEASTGRRVLPIWHKITRADLLQYSPTLADRLAKSSSSDSHEAILRALRTMITTHNGKASK